ncbi:MAG: glycosyltransferase [Saprospiraceae bacterium]|nr:glycosyltransferase [Saprospiraceae bacterium]
MSPPHILLLTPGFPKDENDDSCIPALQSYVRLQGANREMELTIVTLHYPFVDTRYHWFESVVYPMNGMNEGGIGRLKLWYRTIRKIREIHRAKPLHGIHSFWYGECTLLGEYVKRVLDVPHLNTAMGQEFYRPSWIQYLIKWWRSPSTVALSRRQITSMHEFGIEPISQVPWGLDLARIPSPKNHVSRDIDILWVGSLIEIKQPSQCLEAISRLGILHPGIHAVMIGGGELLTALRMEIERLDLARHIELKGDLSRGEVLDFMNRSKILLHTSRFESFGMVYLEALYYGMRIVSYPTGIARESSGWIIANHFEELVNGCTQMLALSQDEKESELLFDLSETCSRYAAFYQPQKV